MDLPKFSAIDNTKIESDITELLAKNKQKIDALVAKQLPLNWDSFILPQEQIDDDLNQSWSPISHLNAVLNSKGLRKAYNACLGPLSEYSSEIGQNQKLYQSYLQLQQHKNYQQYNPAQQKSITDALLDFTLSGVALAETEKVRFREIKKRLSELTAKFSENVLDSTQAWQKHLTDEQCLEGIPQTVLSLFAQQAKAKNLDGYLINLEAPSYLAVMTYAKDQALRKELYLAFSSRASQYGPGGEQYDNQGLMLEILQLRQEMAELLGYQVYSEQSLAKKMAKDTQQVFQFLQDLIAKVRPAAIEEYTDLQSFVQAEFQVANLQAWDIAYYSELKKQSLYHINDELLRPYFPIAKVLQGLFEISYKLYGVEIKPQDGVDTWHDDVSTYTIYKDGEKIAGFYLDLYARENKRGGAWMADCKNRRRLQNGEIQLPQAFLTCNFMPGVDGKPALLTHTEVVTLFHEFGHGLHHMLTSVEVLAVSGISGVAWDAVELPSQFMENFCWQAEGLNLMSGHYQTDEALPGELLTAMLSARNFHAGMRLIRQLEFGLMDFMLHSTKPVAENFIRHQVAAARAQTSVYEVPSSNRFENGFGHIFAGGYAAGYYSYLWAEVLSADAFAAFEEQGLFNRQTGQRFLTQILEKGGSEPAMQLFKAFRGREPDNSALLRHNGLS